MLFEQARTVSPANVTVGRSAMRANAVSFELRPSTFHDTVHVIIYNSTLCSIILKECVLCILNKPENIICSLLEIFVCA